MHWMQITAEAIAKGFLRNASHNISVGSSCMQYKFCYLSFCTDHVLTVCHYLWDGHHVVLQSKLAKTYELHSSRITARRYLCISCNDRDPC